MLAAVALAAVSAPREAGALRDERTAPISGLPLEVEPSPPFARIWLEGRGALDGASLGVTLSDGERWRRAALRPRWDLSAGVGLGPVTGALDGGLGTAAIALQVDAVRRGDWKLGLSAAARIVYGGGYDLSLVPVLASRRTLGASCVLVPFGAGRVRFGRTLYAVQGPSADRSSPFAVAQTRDVAVAALGGLAAVTRFVELRLTAGWEILLVDRLDWEERPTDLSRAGGPFAQLALRFRLGAVGHPLGERP